MFWKKKTPPLPIVTERELEIVNKVIQAMEEHPDHWNITSDSLNRPKLDYPEIADKQTVNCITYTVSCHSPKLTLNNAEIELTRVSKDRLNRAGQELMQENLTRSLTRTEKTLNDNHTS
jgi:hypothetical protein